MKKLSDFTAAQILAAHCVIQYEVLAAMLPDDVIKKFSASRHYYFDPSVDIEQAQVVRAVRDAMLLEYDGDPAAITVKIREIISSALLGPLH